MNPNNSLSYQDSSKLQHYLDQFMPSMPKNNTGPSFQNFMQACFTNPTFFESMKHFYVAQNQKSVEENLSASYQGLNLQPYQQSQPNLSNQSRYEINYQSDTKSQQFQREAEVVKTNEMKRKPANPLTKYFPSQIAISEKANQPLSKPTIPPPQKPSFQERPIKSNYTAALNNNSQAFDLNTIKENQSINIENPKKKVKNFDQEPIRRMNQFQIKQYQIQSNFKQPEEKIKSSSTSYQDERPIKGLSKDFKEAVKQRFPNPMDREQNHQIEEQAENMKPQPKAFLKRGSRQHLSSAMNKSKQPKNNLDKSLNKSQIQDQKDRSTTPKRAQTQIRTISQNKVLSKKSNNQQEKSTSKLHTKKIDISDDQLNNQKTKPYLNRQKPPKPQQKSTKSFQKPQLPVKNIKKKNVFNDDSSSSCSSEQEVSPTFKTKYANQNKSDKNVEIDQYCKKIEVIQGVYLSQQQLDQINSIYSKQKQVPKQIQSEKVVALRRKYNEMIALKDEQMEKYKQELEKERQQFQKYKADQLTKLKNERRIMQRQVKGGFSSQNLQKEKEDIQNLKQELEKQKEDFKRKDKNNKIIIEKYKKQNQDLKSKIDKLENELSLNRRQNNKVEDNYPQQKSVKNINGSVKTKKVEQQQKLQEISYKDLKKSSKPLVTESKQTKSKYEYIQEDNVSKNKSFSSKQEKKQAKIQNKWASHKFTNSDGSASENEDQYQQKITQTSKANEWSPAMKLSDLTKISLSIKMVNQQMIDSLFRYQKNIEYLRYLQSTKLPTRTVVNTTRNSVNKFTTKIYSDRTKQLVYDNGTHKVSCQNGYSIIYFKNGDIKQTLSEKTVLYYFKQKEVDQITLSNGINIYRFENDQVEIHFTNGCIEIRHPDGTIKVLGDQIRR